MMDPLIFQILKYGLTIFTIILIPTYWKNYGPQNFLWLSDIGLFLTVLSFWFHSPLLMSIAIILVLPLEIIWCFDYFYQLLTGKNRLNIVEYMFDTQLSLFVRGLSFFHLVLPIIWLSSLYLWSYDTRALSYAILLSSIVFIATFCLTEPKKNINWVYTPYIYHWRIHSLLWLIILLVGFPLFLIWPSHILFKYFFLNIK